MNENARRWVKELRSGRWTQAQKKLKVDDKFCCLGVACELSGLGNWSKTDFFVIDGDARGRVALPPEVRDWLGLAEDAGDEGSFRDEENVFQCLSGFNDGGKSFAEIADIIEANADQLFISAGE